MFKQCLVSNPFFVQTGLLSIAKSLLDYEITDRLPFFLSFFLVMFQWGMNSWQLTFECTRAYSSWEAPKGDYYTSCVLLPLRLCFGAPQLPMKPFSSCSCIDVWLVLFLSIPHELFPEAVGALARVAAHHGRAHVGVVVAVVVAEGVGDGRARQRMVGLRGRG